MFCDFPCPRDSLQSLRPPITDLLSYYLSIKLTRSPVQYSSVFLPWISSFRKADTQVERCSGPAPGKLCSNQYIWLGPMQGSCNGGEIWRQPERKTPCKTWLREDEYRALSDSFHFPVMHCEFVISAVMYDKSFNLYNVRKHTYLPKCRKCLQLTDV